MSFSFVALAMRHRLNGISTYGLNGLGKGDEHPAYSPLEYYGKLPFFTSLPKRLYFCHAPLVCLLVVLLKKLWMNFIYLFIFINYLLKDKYNIQHSRCL